MKHYQCESFHDQKAVEFFYETLKLIPNYSGMAFIMVEGFCDACAYNPVTQKLENPTFYNGGYRKDSISTTTELTEAQIAELERDIARGGIHVMVRYKIAYKDVGCKDFKVFSIAPNPNPA